MTDSPPQLPDRLLKEPAFLTACAAHEMGTVLRLAAKYTGFGPTRIGRLCNLHPTRVGEYINGKRIIRDIAVICRIADGLRVPGHLLGLAPRPWETSETAFGNETSEATRPTAAGLAVLPPGAPTAATRLRDITGTVEALEQLTEEPMDRRTMVLSSAAMIVPGHLWLLDRERLAAAVSGRPVDAGAMSDIERSINAKRHLPDTAGIQATLPNLRSDLATVVHVIKHNSYTEDIGSRLYAAASELARMVGYLYDENGDIGAARHHLVVALRTAHLSGDRPLGAYTLSLMALMEARSGDPRHAVIMLQTAQAGAHKSMTARQNALIHAGLARANGGIGNLKGIQRHADEALNVLSDARSEEDPPYLHWVDEAELSALHGRAFMLAEAPQQAQRHLETAIDHFDATVPRDQALYRVNLASMQLAQGEVDQACATASQAVDTVHTLGGSHVATAIDQFSTSLTPYRKNPSAAAFIDRAHQLATA